MGNGIMCRDSCFNDLPIKVAQQSGAAEGCSAEATLRTRPQSITRLPLKRYFELTGTAQFVRCPPVHNLGLNPRGSRETPNLEEILLYHMKTLLKRISEVDSLR